jgi:signal recognition particle GTPase
MQSKKQEAKIKCCYYRYCRLAIDEDDDRVSNIKNAVNPQEILFVVDSMTGQDAVNTAKAFNDRLNFSGVVLTKLDGDTEVVPPFQLNTQ